MIGTIWLLLLMLLSLAFKGPGIELRMKNIKHGLILIFLSKAIWWTSFLLILNIWVPEKYFNYVIISSAVIFLFKIYKERKIIFKKNFYKKAKRNKKEAR